METKIKELQEMIAISEGGYRKENEATNAASEFAHDYDWESEWEAFDPVEACEDAFIAGIQFALNHIKQ